MTRCRMLPVDVTVGTHKKLVLGPPSMPSSPAVMLSPKLTNRVCVSFGGLVTVTVNAQALLRCSASVAVQFTVD